MAHKEQALMTKQIEAQRFASEVYDLLDETFEHIHGLPVCLLCNV
jgi:hypothetical protein